MRGTDWIVIIPVSNSLQYLIIVVFVVYRLALGQVLSRVLLFSAVSTILSMRHSLLLNYYFNQKDKRTKPGDFQTNH